MILHLVCDTSGSMAEWGKFLIARGVLRTIEQYTRLGYGSADLRLISWGDTINVLEWQPEQEFPPEILICKGSADINVLIDHISDQPLKGDKVILITDGYWKRENIRDLKRWKDKLPRDSVRLIKVGDDSNPQLQGIGIFSADDIFSALDSWLIE